MSETSIRDEPSTQQVASYLRRNPQFFSDYPDLALSLEMPREQGASTSLASYQLDVLRDKNRELNQRLRELIEIAAENEQLMVRVHSLTLALMRENTLGQSLCRAAAGLTEDFQHESQVRTPAQEPGFGSPDASTLRLVLFREPGDDLPAADWLILAPGGVNELPAFAEFLKRGEPLCGRLQPDKLDALFGAHASEIHSTVLVPIDGRGMLAIGSHDANRFHPGMGTVFLRLIAEAIGAAVARFAQA